MKIHIASDLHLEISGRYPELPGGDILLLAGDTVVADHLHDGTCDHHRLARKFFATQVAKYRHCLVLMGNHEHYRGVFEDTSVIYARFLAACAPNTQLLDDATRVIDGVAFVGSTLWAPCRGVSPLVELGIGQGMNDFRMIRKAHGRRATRRFTTADARAHHERSAAFLRAEVARHDKVVVLTHHAPSLKSNTKYQAGGHWTGDTLTPAYCSDLEDIMIDNPQISHWIHGHTHQNSDYQIGSTRVLSNQHGYLGRERIAQEFDPTRGAFEVAA